MKRILLASTLAAALLMHAPPAHALFGVGDVVFDPTSWASLVEQLNALRQQYQVMQQQYQMAESTFNTLSHPNQLVGSLAGNLQQGRLPGSVSEAMPGLAYGSTLATGAQRFLSQNRLYAPQGSDFAALEMQRREMATSNMQAEAQAGMDRAQGRLAALSELQNNIPTQPDIQAMTALNARINSEGVFLANEQASLTRMQIMAANQTRVDQQRQEQNDRKSYEDYAAAQAAKAGF